MNEKQMHELIDIGCNLGIYTIASLLAEGVDKDAIAWEKLARRASEGIEETCGMPAEDFALKLQPIVSHMERMIKGEEL